MSDVVDVLTVGILVADHLCAPIPRLPRAGELVLADSLPLAIGGCASNAAVDLARVGVQVGVVGCVGDDIFGRFIRESLAREGVETGGIRALSGVGTSGTLIVNVAGEDRRFIHSVGANGRFRATDVPLERVRRAKVLYVGGYMIMPSVVQEELAALFRAARQAGVKTVLDVVLPGPGDYARHFDRVLAETDVFLPNTDEAAIITGLSDPVRQAETFLAAGARTVVITCGREGAVLLTPNLRLRCGVYPVDYVGGTGSGDAFDAGFIAGMLAGCDERGCLEWGAALGASCVRAIGATESVFTRDEALAFIRDHHLPLDTLP